MRSKCSCDKLGREYPLWMRELKLKRSRMMNYMIKILFVFAFLGGVASAVTVDLESAADADIRKSAPDTAVGNRTEHLVSAYASSVAKAYMRFALPADIDTITDVSFTVVVSDSPYWNATVDIYGLDDDVAGQSWAEGNLTWNNAPGNDTSSDSGFLAGGTTNVGNFAVNGSNYGGNVGDAFTNSSVSLLDFLNTDSDGVVNILLGTTFSSDNVIRFASKEHATLAAPKLMIVYIPKETATVALEPAADADVRSNTPDTADGSRTGLLVSGASSQAGKAYMRFVLPGNIEAITEASFTVILSDRPYWNTLAGVYGLNDDVAGQSWTEGSLTWNNAPGNDTASYSGFLAGSTTNVGSFTASGSNYGRNNGDAYTFSSASLLEFLNTDSDGVVNILLGTGDASTDWTQFASKENATWDAPKLTLTYVVRPPQGTLIILR